MALITLHIEADSPEEFNRTLRGLCESTVIVNGDMHYADVADPEPVQPAEVEAPNPTKPQRGRPRKPAPTIDPPHAAESAEDVTTPSSTSDPFADSPPEPEPSPAIVNHTKDEVQKVMIDLMDKGVKSNQLNEILMKATGFPNVGAMDPSFYNAAYQALNDALIVLG